MRAVFCKALVPSPPPVQPMMTHVVITEARVSEGLLYIVSFRVCLCNLVCCTKGAPVLTWTAEGRRCPGLHLKLHT